MCAAVGLRRWGGRAGGGTGVAGQGDSRSQLSGDQMPHRMRHAGPGGGSGEAAPPGFGCSQRPARPVNSQMCQQHVAIARCKAGAPCLSHSRGSTVGLAIGAIGAPPAKGDDQYRCTTHRGSSISQQVGRCPSRALRSTCRAARRPAEKLRAQAIFEGRRLPLERSPGPAPLASALLPPAPALCWPPGRCSQLPLPAAASQEAEQLAPAAAATLPPHCTAATRRASLSRLCPVRPLTHRLQLACRATCQDVQPGLRRGAEHGLCVPGRRPVG